MFHSKNGLFFCRLNDSGEVRIIKTRDGKMPDPDTNPPESAVTLTENEWASVVCSVSKGGDDHARWMRARRFHGTEFSELQPSGADETPQPLTAEDEEWLNAPLGTPRPAELSLMAENDILKKHGCFTRSRYTGFGADAQDCTCCGAIQNGHGGIHNAGCALAKIFHQPEAISEANTLVGVKLNNADGTDTVLTNDEYWQRLHVAKV